VARYERTYAGERRSAHLGVQLTPSERDELKAAAANEGATVSEFTREVLLRRLGSPGVAGTRRSPHTAAVIRALDAAAFENSANGNNLNQIARHLNTTGELGDLATELREAIARFNKAADLHIAALERVLAQ
jgi:Bacterial mobilisation protein (MobC)